jgi:hypothetical protein
VSTFNELADSTLHNLSGFSGLQDQATYLTASLSSAAVTGTVFDASALSRGLIEIEDEVIWVDNVDAASGTLTIPPYGRGYLSSAAAAHASGVRVAAPMIPRVTVKRAINEAIAAVFPDLYAVAQTTFVYVPGTYTYSLPVETEDVIQVQWQDATTASEWIRINRYDIDAVANTITLNDFVVPGRTVRVNYTKQPSPLVAGTDAFSVTGLPSSCEDLIRLGAAYRLVSFIDVPHLSGNSSESDYATSNKPANLAIQNAKYLLQTYQMRLQQEASRLNGQFPIRIRYSD